MQSVDRTFQITRADKNLLVKQEYDVQVVGFINRLDMYTTYACVFSNWQFNLFCFQAWCMFMNDKVLFRMQWPQYADLQVNGL